MTEFHKDGFSVHVYTGSSPAEAWLRLHKELAWLMEKVSGDDAPRGMYAVCSLFDALMPSWKQACRLAEDASTDCPVDRDLE